MTKHAEIAARLKAATPGEWRVKRRQSTVHGISIGTVDADVCEVVTDDLNSNPGADADFIAHAPSDIALLLAEITRLEAIVDDRGIAMTYAELRAEAAEAEVATLREALTFDALRAANVMRCKRWHPNFLSDDGDEWSGADWSNAMCGEAGETANVVKKLRRIETGNDQGPDDPPPERLREMLADEIADTVTYADLLAAHYGIDLAAAIAAKFNRVSERQGFPDRLATPTATAMHDYEGNWPYEPCHVCGKQGLQGDAAEHRYEVYPGNSPTTAVTAREGPPPPHSPRIGDYRGR